MKIKILSIGKWKNAAESELCDLYAKRLRYPITLEQLVVKDPHPKPEGEALLKKIKPTDWIIALDEKGTELTSTAFAQKLNTWQQLGKDIVFVIGGAEGLSAAAKARGNIILSLSCLTFPHLLVRPILMEQLYRAQSLQSGHPYHKQSSF